jgi:hypothetical protein
MRVKARFLYSNTRVTNNSATLCDTHNKRNEVAPVMKVAEISATAESLGSLRHFCCLNLFRARTSLLSTICVAYGDGGSMKQSCHPRLPRRARHQIAQSLRCICGFTSAARVAVAVMVTVLLALYRVHDEPVTNWTTAGVAKCRTPLMIIAHGSEKDSGYADLCTYLKRHVDIPAAMIYTGSGRPDRVQTFNLAPDSKLAAAIFKRRRRQLIRMHSDLLNSVHLLAVVHERPCRIFEWDTRLRMTRHRDAITSIITLALDQNQQRTSLRVGVRLRGASHLEDASHTPPVLNAYTLFSPNRYYAPRGLPSTLVAADRRGEGPNIGELVRVQVEHDAIAVVQSAIDGMPDVDEECRTHELEQVQHQAILKSVIVPAPSFHPYNNWATLHEYDGIWAMFLPASIRPGARDVFRGYVTQAILPLIGRYFALVAPLVVGNSDQDTTQSRHDAHMRIIPIERWDKLTSYLSQWQRQMQSLCSSHHDVCRDAGTLLIRLYTDLANEAFVSKSDKVAATKWVLSLEKAGYAVPKSWLGRPPSATATISPKRPVTHNVHAAVHVNWGKSWRGLIPLWHATHAAQYKQVTYHVQRRPNIADPSLVPSIYPHMTFTLDDPPGVTSGYLAYQSATQAWSVHDRSTEAMLWMHEDALIKDDFLRTWLLNRTSCVATGAISHLPTNTAEWRQFWWKPWPQQTRVQVASKHFLELVSSRKGLQQCVSIDFDTDGLPFGHADIVALRTRCKMKQRRRMFDLLQAAADAGLFMEIGWPASIRCAFSPEDIHEYRLYTRFDRHRNDPQAAWREFSKNMHDAFHPVKFAPNVMTRLAMRDSTWQILEQTQGVYDGHRGRKSTSRSNRNPPLGCTWCNRRQQHRI